VRVFLTQPTEVGGRNLQGVEHNSSLFRIEPPVQQVFADLRDGCLDRGGVLKDRQVEESGGIGCGGADVELHGTTPLVEVAKLLIAQGGRTALRSVHSHALALFDWIS
jgi:hypothetical protein